MSSSLTQLSIIFLQVIVLSTAASHIRYVKPNDLSPQGCPSHPCLTLDQYTQSAEDHFVSGAIFIFLPGNHTLQSTIHLASISALSFISNHSDSYIICRSSILCENVTRMNIEGLAFILYSGNYSSSAESALQLLDSEQVQISNTTFEGTGDLSEPLMRAIHSNYSTVNITNCVFQGNTGDYGGAIVATTGSNISLSGNIFNKNKAVFDGGAIHADLGSHIILLETHGNSFIRNLALGKGGAVSCYRSSTVEIGGVCTKTLPEVFSFSERVTPCVTLFTINKAARGGGVCVRRYSVAKINGILVMFTNNSAEDGGAMNVEGSSVISKAEYLNFTGNTVRGSGGAIKMESSQLRLGTLIGSYFHHYFLKNSAIKSGGAIDAYTGEIIITGNSHFTQNFAGSTGGAIESHFVNLVFFPRTILSSNEAKDGGAMYLAQCSISSGSIPTDRETCCVSGLQESPAVSRDRNVIFHSNVAHVTGGGIYSYESDLTLSAVDFINNTAGWYGGATYIEGREFDKNTFYDVSATGNSGSAIHVIESNIVIGSSVINQNVGHRGGGIYCEKSSLCLTSNTTLDENTASFGGAIYAVLSTISVCGRPISLARNLAHTNGGAIYTEYTDITLKDRIDFEHNSAHNGGALYLAGGANSLDIYRPGGQLVVYHNNATEYGGAIYKEDKPTFDQCHIEATNLRDVHVFKLLPKCFLAVITDLDIYPDIIIDSYQNSAGKDGNVLYGGLLDKCQLRFWKIYVVFEAGNDGFFNGIAETKENGSYCNDISSKPYQLCLCNKNSEYSCSGVIYLNAYRGQRFYVPLVALNQVRVPVETSLRAITNSSASLKIDQNLQQQPSHCHEHTYNLYSKKNHEELVLYPKGPCNVTGLARVVLKVTFLPCPNGFTRSGQQCVCEERLQPYDAECIIDEDIFIVRKAGSKFWMSTLIVNDSYQGLILYITCPDEYCTDATANITLDELDAICDPNRSGILCGRCAANFSLMLGGSQCKKCHSAYLGLLFPFATVGIVLVIFLSFLRLTVATGLINSLILYANIIQANKNILLPSNRSNILTVFVAWLNLDLGIQTCFYDGMDAYAQTWLQFAFPGYVWIIITLIILVSRYSSSVSKLIGSNPIAVLATLILMSYTKILRIVIDVYSSVDLDYPDNKIVTVWLKDANVPYLRSKHLLLTVVTSLVLAFFFLPYTLLLLLGYKLYRFSGRKHFGWLRRLKPLLDSYYAPYKIHTRYWTGFLLLVRCALYIVFSFNSLGASTKSLLAINITFTAIVILAWLSVLIYRSFYVNIIEASVYLNLIALSTATLAGVNTPALAYTLVSLVFITMIGVIAYHFHLLYTAKSPIWLKLKGRVSNFIERNKNPSSESVDGPPNTSSQEPHKIISETVIELREPLLEQ